MKQTIFDAIEEQVSFNFNGRINVLNASNKQFLGVVFIKEGSLWSVSFNSSSAEKALFRIHLAENTQPTKMDYIVEPEIFDDVPRNIHHPYNAIKKDILKKYQEFLASDKLRPPDGLKVLINKGFISGNAPVSQDEFEILCTISDYNRVSDIYKNAPLLEYETTMTLISLRKKGALRVIR